jgi:hypothetical protein
MLKLGAQLADSAKSFVKILELMMKEALMQITKRKRRRRRRRRKRKKNYPRRKKKRKTKKQPLSQQLMTREYSLQGALERLARH